VTVEVVTFVAPVSQKVVKVATVTSPRRAEFSPVAFFFFRLTRGQIHAADYSSSRMYVDNAYNLRQMEHREMDPQGESAARRLIVEEEEEEEPMAPQRRGKKAGDVSLLVRALFTRRGLTSVERRRSRR
jgi:hypothetical protein